MFPCEFCDIFKNTYFKEHLETAALTIWKLLSKTYKVESF